MKPVNLPRRQRGVTLVVGLIMLVLITLVVSTAFMMSTTNLRAVGNMQFRDEAVAAADVAIERLMSTDFTTDPAGAVANPFNVDIDNDGVVDYVVNVATPVCTKSVPLVKLAETDPDYTTCTVGVGGATLCYETIWDLRATVSAAGAALLTGATATIRQGVSKRLSVSKLNCP